MRFYRHLLVNIRLPYIHVLFTRFIQLFSGSMIIELIFNYPGVGLLTYEAVRFGDYPLALTLITSIGIFIALIHFVLELISPFLDPRLA